MSYQEDLKSLFGLHSVTYKYGLDKDTLFDDAIANDRGRVTADGPDDQLKASPTKLGKDGPLVFYTDPSCTGRPVKDTFAVAHPEFEERIWWKNDFQKFDPDKFAALVARVGEHLNQTKATLHVQDLFCGTDPEYAVPYRWVGEYASHAMFVHRILLPST